MIFDIQHVSLSDGPGIRTTVFLKGCQLRCLWCHNPESLHPEAQLMFHPEQCINCGRCAGVCPQNCHTMHAAHHQFDRSRCTNCGACAAHCIPGALTVCGKEQEVSAILDEVEKDRDLYNSSGGGLTISGGEPLFQPEFTEQLCRDARKRNIHICLDTSGFAPEAVFRRIVPLADLVLFDIKTVIPAKHLALTGADNALVLKNLSLPDNHTTPFILRCPLIPELNDSPEELAGIAGLANKFKHVRAIHIEPYHPLGRSKRQKLGLPLPPLFTIPDQKTIDNWYRTITRLTGVEVEVC